ncbi:MAG: hypothetical protein ACOYY2_02995 [Actinomycetota bacterium]
MKPAGRPSLLTPEIHERIVQAIAAGNFGETAARAAGIATATYYQWMAKGRDERTRRENGERPKASQSKYVDFAEAVESAKAQAETRAVTLITKAALDGTWQAAAWYLERTQPQKYGRFTRTEVTGADGGAVRVEQVSAEDLAAKVDQVLAARAVADPASPSIGRGRHK